MNFKVIDGEYDSPKLFKRFVELYHTSMRTTEIRDELGVTDTKMKKLRAEALEKGLITPRNPYARGRPKHKARVKNYGRCGTYYTIRHKRKYYCSCKTERQARRIVELFEECGWDINEKDRIKAEVKGL